MESHSSHPFHDNGHKAALRLYFAKDSNGISLWPQYDVVIDDVPQCERRLVPTPWNKETLIMQAREEYRHVLC